MTAAHESYANGCLLEIQGALAAGQIVKGWQYGANLRIRSVERAPADSEFWFSGETFSGMPFHFTTYSIQDTPRNDGATPEDFAWLESFAAGNDRKERNHALRLLVTLRRPRRR